MAILHDPNTHELGQQHFTTKTWYFCGTPDCFAVVCGECNHATCVCSMTDEEVQARNDKRLMRDRSRPPARSAQKKQTRSLALAIWDEGEVGSDGPEREAPSRDERPQEGRDMAAKKKATKKATTKATDETKVDKRTDAEARRGRGELENLVVEVTDAFEAGKVELPEGKTLTPQRIANIIGEKPNEDKPSGGAVAAILKRWEESGYALVHPKPYAFKAVSARGKKQGLDDLKAKLREKKKAEKAAEKESAKK